MKALSIMAFLALIYSQGVLAHGGGHGPVSESRAIAIASETANQFVDVDAGLGFGKLSKGWKDLPSTAKRIHAKGNGYYIVSMANEKEGRTIYVLMSVAGEVYDANFSGEFPGLK